MTDLTHPADVLKNRRSVDMSSPTLLEKAALAIDAADTAYEQDTKYWELAEAAIAAVREYLSEPSEAMIGAADFTASDGCSIDVAAPRIWRAMLAAAFEDKP